MARLRLMLMQPTILVVGPDGIGKEKGQGKGRPRVYATLSDAWTYAL